MTAPTQGRRAEVVAWARMSHDGSAIADVCLPCEMQSVEMWAYGVKELVYADTLAEMQRRVESALRLADELDDVVLGNEMNGYVQGAIERVANEIRAILGGDGGGGVMDSKAIERAVMADQNRPCLYGVAGPCFHPNCLEAHFHTLAAKEPK